MKTLQKRIEPTSASISAFKDGIAAQCSGILAGNIYDRHSFFGYSYHSKKFYSWACESNFQTSDEMKRSALGLSIPIEGIPLGIDFSSDSTKFQQSLHNWCSSSSASIFDQDFSNKYSETINTAMVAAFSKCVEQEKEAILGKYGVFATAEPENRFLESFIVSVRFRPLGTDRPNRIESIEGSAQCFYQGRPLRLPFDTPRLEIALTCKKPGQTTTAISFNTAPTNASPVVELPGKDQDTLDRLTQELANTKYQLRTQISRARDDINRLSRRHLEWRPHPHEDFAPAPNCPPGYAVLYDYCEGDCSSDDARIRMCVPNDTVTEIPK